MSFSLEDVQEGILAFLRAESEGFEVVEQAYPDVSTVDKGPDGKVVPYYSVRFGDERQAGATAMSGAFDDDYRLPFTITAIAGDASYARKMANRMSRIFVGKTFSWAGQVRKRGGAGMISTASNSATEAYGFPKTFDITVQLHVD